MSLKDIPRAMPKNRPRLRMPPTASIMGFLSGAPCKSQHAPLVTVNETSVGLWPSGRQPDWSWSPTSQGSEMATSWNKHIFIMRILTQNRFHKHESAKLLAERTETKWCRSDYRWNSNDRALAQGSMSYEGAVRTQSHMCVFLVIILGTLGVSFRHSTNF